MNTRRRSHAAIALLLLVILLLPSAVSAQASLGALKFLGGNVTLPAIIGRVIKGLLGFVGGIALLMFVWGGVQWMIAAGNQEKIKKAKDNLLWSTLGLLAIFVSFALVTFILGFLDNPSK